MSQNQVDIALVRMPYSELGQPSLALGLLKASCDKLGLTTRGLAANLWFAEEVGPIIHDLIFEVYSSTLIGEWTFAGALFPDFQPDDDAYLRKTVDILGTNNSVDWRYLHDAFPYLDYVALLREIRRRAPDFVERAADRVLALNPKIVGCTSTFQQHCASLALLRAIKQRRPDVVTMIGGANCEGEMGRTTFEQFPFLDFVASGEADGYFGPLCQTLLRGGIEAALPELPAGVWGPHHRQAQAAALRADAAHVDGAPIVRVENMDDSPIPNYDDYFRALSEAEILGEHIRPALPFQTARGCWWGEKTHCTFCGISRTAMKFRGKSGDNVMEQMIALRDRYGINTFQGTEYIFDYRYFETLLPRLKDLGAYFRFEVKANLKAEQCKAFVEAGVIEVQPGVEGLHDKTLALLRKGTTTLQNVLLLKRGLKAGLSVYWNLLHTIPGDQDEWYGETAELTPLLHHLQPPVAFAQIHYDRFSPYWRDPAQFGLTLQPAFGYEHVYPFAPETRREMAYFFETPRQRDGFLKYNVAEHPGLFSLIHAISRWQAAFRGRPRARFVAEDLGDRIRFEDTRAVAVAPTQEIDGLEARVYRMCEDGAGPANVERALVAEGVSSAAVQAAVESLIAKKLVAVLSGRLLALAVVAPVGPLLVETLDRSNLEIFPTQGKLEADRLLNQRRESIAVACTRAPQDAPLSAWLASTARGSRESRAQARQAAQTRS